MLSTTELEKYIKVEITDKLNDVNWEKINFRKGNETSAEGTYIFSSYDGYQFFLPKRGKSGKTKL